MRLSKHLRESLLIPGATCAYCGAGVNRRGRIDSIVPLSRGGRKGPHNRAVSCKLCDMRKGNLTPEELVAWAQRVAEVARSTAEGTRAVDQRRVQRRFCTALYYIARSVRSKIKEFRDDLQQWSNRFATSGDFKNH